MAHFEINRRDGLSSMIAEGKEMCRLIVKFKPVIVVLYPANPELALAMTVALEACETLTALAAAQKGQGE